MATDNKMRCTAYFLLGLILLLTFFPLWFMLVTSFKSVFQFYHNFWWPSWPLYLSNYMRVFKVIYPYILNSIFTTIASVIGIVFLGALSGFVFARFWFPAKRLLYYAIIGLMMLPWILTLVPAFMVVKKLGMINTFWVLILPYIASGQVLSFYMFHNFFCSLPEELFESARLDGAGVFQQFYHIGAALSRPLIGLVAIVSSLSVWNNFIWPLVTTSDERLTVLTVGVMRFNVAYTSGAIDYGQLFAGYTLAALPLLVLFLFATRQFMAGLTAGALKE
ncbi:MAG TPA: carbohydrate ABC transporter permease [bacterium]|jgi:ABC-type glycerol-3-phosphate transport system permease component|nr:carbohydrate ABC transporter permease [bacterium]HOX87413.1 carbohydrate ABC transporter permease [bacterium]HPG46874.1 carbohydrate ABC transporter permease [bacterium]HPM99146.1 carbohydrate ABC transporter permease [bacterium]